MKTLSIPLGPRSFLGFSCLAFAVVGCGSSFKTVPVSGRVLVDGEPLTIGNATVLFKPDASKGNKSKLDFAGKVDNEGNYSLYYGKGNAGVAPGWYKVAVVAMESPQTRPEPNKERPKGPPPRRRSLIDTKYTLPASSGIEIEVVENPTPGAYDLNLKGAPKQK